MILLDAITNIDDAILTAERIQQQLKLGFHLEGSEIFTGVSIGIALSGLHEGPTGGAPAGCGHGHVPGQEFGQESL